MGTVGLAIMFVVLALVLSAVLVFLELKKKRDIKDHWMWARLNGLDPDDEDNQQWYQDYWGKLHSHQHPGLLSRLKDLVWGDWDYG